MKPLTLQEVITTCIKHNHKYVNGWVKSSEKFTAECTCGNVYVTRLGNIVKGCHCSVCSGGVQHDPETIAEELRLMGLDILKPYLQSRVPIMYTCSCGGIGNTVLHKLRDGQRCGNCAENNWRLKFLSEGFEIIKYVNAQNVTYKCVCGAEHNCQANNWLTQHKGCPACKIKYNYNPDKLTRPCLHVWRKQVLQRDNYTCQLCKYEGDLHVHHIIGYAAQPELASDVTNGITLCNVCHTQLHSKYGYNVGKDNLNGSAV